METAPQVARLPDDDILFLIHVPRTAGTAINLALQAVLGPRLLYHQAVANAAAAAGEPYEAYIRARPDIYDGVRVIAGHMRVDDPLVRLCPRRAAFAGVLREPLARAVSLYDYARHTPAHVAYVPLRQMTLFQAIQTLEGMRDNVVCAQILQLFHTHDRVAIARRIATGRYLLGRHDRMELFWEAMQHLLGLAAPLGRANGAAELVRGSALTPARQERDFEQAMELVRLYSAHEIAFYQRMPPLVISPALRTG